MLRLALVFTAIVGLLLTTTQLSSAQGIIFRPDKPVEAPAKREKRKAVEETKPGKPRPADKASDPLAAFLGRWQGQYSCDRGGDGVGDAVVDVVPENGGLVVTARYKRGSTSGKNVLRLVRQESTSSIIVGITRTVGYSYEIRLRVEGSSMSGEYIGHPNCQSMSLSRAG